MHWFRLFLIATLMLALSVPAFAQIGEDFGDAPDPGYPTYAASNGAFHPFTLAYKMGALIDAEQDGQPDAASLGDDNMTTDDEDGVVFASPLMPGTTGSVSIDMTGSALGGYIDAWVDFGNNGSWLEAGDQILMSVWAPGGVSTSFNFPVPASAVPGITYSRFRMSSTGGLTFTGVAMDGEVEDHTVLIDNSIEEWKWEQLPDLGMTGIDVNCTEPFVLADDFLCEEPGRLTHIDIWGSWLADYLPFGWDPLAVDFVLSIHEDIPAEENPDGYSMPGEVLWIHAFPAGQFMTEMYAGGIVEGWMDPPDMYMFPADWTCWMYTFDIPPEEAFHQVGMPDSGVVYWLDVQAYPHDFEALFGWKTTLDHWNDDAVWGMGMEPYWGPWDELVYPPMHEMAGQSIDLAFRLNMDYGTDVPDDIVPDRHSLRQNVPNPFNPMTTIAYEVPAGGGHVTIEIVDVAGRVVRTLVDGPEAEGVRSVVWDGTDANGDQMATGVYFYRMTADEVESVRKMMLLK
ncbi:hypothetical protein K8S17_03085 [bacterium]|nr:hypothetical protein [bacterium]